MFAFEKASMFKVRLLIHSVTMKSPDRQGLLGVKGDAPVFNASPGYMAFLNLLEQWRMPKVERL